MVKKMKKKNMKIENIVGIFVIMLLASIFVMPVSAQSPGIPIKLELTAEPSTIEVGETAIITVRLLDENDKPVVTEVDISVSISTNLGSVPSTLIIPAKKDLAETQFTSEVSGIAVIYVKSKGLISDTTSIAVVPLPTPTPSPSPSPSPTPTLTPTPTPTPTPMPPNGVAPPATAGETTISIEPTGEVKSSVTATSADAKAAATILAGTIAKDAAGKPLTMVMVTSPSILPAGVPSGVAYVGYTYNFVPVGATFSRPIEISIEFDPVKFEDRTPVIYTYEAGKWVRLDTMVVGNKATAKVTHVFTFVLFAEEKVPEITTTPTATPTLPILTPTPTPTPAPMPALPPGAIPGFEAALAIAGILAIAYLLRRRG